MSFSIGEEIKKKVKDRGMTNIFFAEQMDMEERNLYHFFKKKEMTIDQLVKASRILNHDFVNMYIRKKLTNENDTPISVGQDVLRDKADEYQASPEISFTVNILGRLDTIKAEMPDLLSAISREAESRGLHLG